MRGIRIETDYAEEIDVVALNSIAMKMVLSNLIGNAIKYNKKDGSVLVTTLRNGDRLVIGIDDTVLGIDPDDIPHIFDPNNAVKKIERR